MLAVSSSTIRSQPRRNPIVKICGIMCPEHAHAAAEAGADMLGLVFAPSRRQIAIETAKDIVQSLSSITARPVVVGVFVNAPLEEIVATAQAVGLDIVQMSGDEGPSGVARVAHYYPVLKALRFPGNTLLPDAHETCRAYASLGLGERLCLLVDTYHPASYGGTGETSNWELAASLAARYNIILAGGLTPVNVGLALSAVAPLGVDVSSGVELEGSKDPELICQFVKATHSFERMSRI